MPVEANRDLFEKARGAMRTERQPFIPHYKNLSEFIQPRRGRFIIQDRNKTGEARWSKIINSKATWAHRTASAGMLAGTMSAARPWFKYDPPDLDMLEFLPVKIWLGKLELLIRTIFNRGNLYNMSPVVLDEMLLFATGCMTHTDDFQDVARFYAHTAGSYMIAQNDRFVVDELMREFEMTTLQMIAKFGLGKVSQTVKNAYDLGNYYNWYPTVHYIFPNQDADPTRLASRFKPFRSVYYEPGNVDRNQLLEDMGFEEFPAYVPRWKVTGEDIYGTDCPAMTTLGDIKGLQIEERRKAQGIDKMVNPPLHGPASLKNVPTSSLPGGTTFYDTDGSKHILKPVYEVNPQLGELRLDITAVERRITDGFYIDMFLAISNMEGIQPRNQLDLSQRNEERLLQLGPVLQQIHGELLAKMVERTYNQAVRAGIVGPAPVELQGKQLQLRFISSLALAQRAVAVEGIERVASYAGGLVQAGFQGVLDKFDAEQSLQEYADAIGTGPRIIVPDEIVTARREQRAQIRQQEQALAMAQQAADTAKTASEADLTGDNALTRGA